MGRSKEGMRGAVLLLAILGAALVLFSGAALAQDESLPDLTVEKTGPSTAGANDFIEYRFDVTNVGSGDAVLPSGAVLVRDDLRVPGTLRGSSIGTDSGGLVGVTGISGLATETGSVSRKEFRVDLRNSESTDAIISPGGGLRQAGVFIDNKASGDFIINCATADPDNVIVESDESNNIECITTKIMP
jgi:hypothetical protein